MICKEWHTKIDQILQLYWDIPGLFRGSHCIDIWKCFDLYFRITSTVFWLVFRYIMTCFRSNRYIMTIRRYAKLPIDFSWIYLTLMEGRFTLLCISIPLEHRRDCIALPIPFNARTTLCTQILLYNRQLVVITHELIYGVRAACC